MSDLLITRLRELNTDLGDDAADEIERLREALQAQTAIVSAAQNILTKYLIPDGIDDASAIDQLLGLLDGQDQRSALERTRAALSPAPSEGGDDE